MGYMMDLRKIVGSRPLIMAGACVIIVNSSNYYYSFGGIIIVGGYLGVLWR